MTNIISGTTLGLTMKLSLFLYLLVTTWPGPGSNASMLTRYRVRIMDNLPDKSNKLVVHCKSGDSDKGVRALSPGQEYTWRTRVNFLRTTLYFCLLNWETVKRRYIEAFEAHRDETRCKYMKACLWMVRTEGIYFSSDNITWSNEYPW